MECGRSLSSAQYLSTPEGLATVREMIGSVRATLRKAHRLKQLIKIQMAADLNDLDKKSSLLRKPRPVVSREVSAGPSVVYGGSQNPQIEISDDSDCEAVTVPAHPSISLDESFEEERNDVNDSQSQLNELSSFGDNQSEVSYSSLSETSDTACQVYFTIVSETTTEGEVSEALLKENFSDFSIVIKNKTFHSYGFIKFSSLESAQRALEMSYKMYISGKPLTILPYQKRTHRKSRDLDASTAKERMDPQSGGRAIEENSLINIACDYARNRLIDPTSDEYVLRFGGCMDENLSPIEYPPPHLLVGPSRVHQLGPGVNMLVDKAYLNDKRDGELLLNITRPGDISGGSWRSETDYSTDIPPLMALSVSSCNLNNVRRLPGPPGPGSTSLHGHNPSQPPLQQARGNGSTSNGVSSTDLRRREEFHGSRNFSAGDRNPSVPNRHKSFRGGYNNSGFISKRAAASSKYFAKKKQDFPSKKMLKRLAHAKNKKLKKVNRKMKGSSELE